jgi:colanic acid biosynthesis glycosyl transferase WcaI
VKARILFITNLFQPEPNHLKGISFIKALMASGHKVHVLTGFPNYPGGKVYPGYRIRWIQREEIEGVSITRVAMYPSHNQSSFDRSCNYLSLGFSMLAHMPWLREKFDICYIYLGPITLLWPAMWLKQRHGTMIIADVQDIWPESVTASGMLHSRLLLRAIDVLTRWGYRMADHFVVLSPGYKDLFIARGFIPDRIEVIYNWTDEDAGLVLEDESDTYLDKTKFNILYAGNIGPLQGLDTLLDAVKIAATRGSRCNLVLIGAGVEYDHIAHRITSEKIVNATIFQRVSASKARTIQNKADMLLLHLVRTPVTEIGIPQKVQAYMSSGRPILTAVAGEAARLVNEAKCGFLCEPSNAHDIADTILKAENLLPATLDEMGVRGREFYKQNLGFNHGVEKVKDLIALMLRR